jgi:hypothetical protein
MTWQGNFETHSIPAGENLTNGQYFAIALDDGKLANNGSEAIGILQNKPAIGEHATLGVKGIMKFRAGAAVTIGKKMTVTTSGYCITVGSGYYGVGRALEAVSSGAVGVGLFDFTYPQYANTSDFIG